MYGSTERAGMNQAHVRFEEAPFTKRKEECDRVRNMHPSRVPCIVQTRESTEERKLSRRKYLVPTELRSTELLYVLRKHLKIGPHEALFLFCGNRTLGADTVLGDIYKKSKSMDGFLYVDYAFENTFGNVLLRIPCVST